MLSHDSQLIKIISRNPRHRMLLSILSILRWVLVSIRSRGGELPAQRLSKGDGRGPDCKPRVRSTDRLLLGQLWDLWRRRVESFGGHKLFKVCPQQCSERRQNSPHWRILGLKKHRVDLGGRLSFPAGALLYQAWRQPLHHPAFLRPDRGDWRILHRWFGNKLPSEQQRTRDAANSDEIRQTNARLWCLPGCRQPTGEEALNSFDLDDYDYDVFETWFQKNSYFSKSNWIGKTHAFVETWFDTDTDFKTTAKHLDDFEPEIQSWEIFVNECYLVRCFLSPGGGLSRAISPALRSVCQAAKPCFDEIGKQYVLIVYPFKSEFHICLLIRQFKSKAVTTRWPSTQVAANWSGGRWRADSFLSQGADYELPWSERSSS